MYRRKNTSCLVVYNDDLIMNNFKQINREICTHFKYFRAKAEDTSLTFSLNAAVLLIPYTEYR